MSHPLPFLPLNCFPFFFYGYCTILLLLIFFLNFICVFYYVHCFWLLFHQLLSSFHIHHCSIIWYYIFCCFCLSLVFIRFLDSIDTKNHSLFHVFAIGVTHLNYIFIVVNFLSYYSYIHNIFFKCVISINICWNKKHGFSTNTYILHFLRILFPSQHIYNYSLSAVRINPQRSDS